MLQRLLSPLFKRSCRIRPLYHGIFVQRHRPPADRVYQSDEQRVRRCIPSYFDLREDGSLKLNYLSPFFIKSMHDKGIKVVPFLSNHWNRTAGINALKNIESLSTQIADYVEEYDLDGINVDIENVTHEQKDQYTQFVKLLREKIPGIKKYQSQ